MRIILELCPRRGSSRFRNWAATSYRFAFWAGSFHYIRMRGRQATRAEAPILVAASHSTFADTLVIYLKGPPASVAKAEAASYPLIGSMLLLYFSGFGAKTYQCFEVSILQSKLFNTYLKVRCVYS